MIERVEIRNWQSLRAVDLDLGRLTVIIGPSSSGKSALLRALRAVACNVRGGGHITRGATAAAITVRTDRHIVTLERSAATGRYLVLDTHTGQESSYPNLGGAVPQAVADALGVQAAFTGVHFAGQFDPPYLLNVSGGEVARQLGELTQVNRLYAAVGQARRRRNALAAQLRTRTADLAGLRARADGFAALPGRLTACARAETIAAHAGAVHTRIAALDAGITALAGAEAVLARADVPALPASHALDEAHTRLSRFRTLLESWIAAAHAQAGARDAAATAAADETALHTRLHDTLVTAGTCPTCGRPTAGV